jgi:hypothetical protein
MSTDFEVNVSARVAGRLGGSRGFARRGVAGADARFFSVFASLPSDRNKRLICSVVITEIVDVQHVADVTLNGDGTTTSEFFEMFPLPLRASHSHQIRSIMR